VTTRHLRLCPPSLPPDVDLLVQSSNVVPIFSPESPEHYRSNLILRLNRLAEKIDKDIAETENAIKRRELVLEREAKRLGKRR
jgi:hypothetical protein